MAVVAVTLPWNATVWAAEVLVMAMVAQETAAWNVVVPELVIVTGPPVVVVTVELIA